MRSVFGRASPGSCIVRVNTVREVIRTTIDTAAPRSALRGARQRSSAARDNDTFEALDGHSARGRLHRHLVDHCTIGRASSLARATASTPALAPGHGSRARWPSAHRSKNAHLLKISTGDFRRLVASSLAVARLG